MKNLSECSLFNFLDNAGNVSRTLNAIFHNPKLPAIDNSLENMKRYIKYPLTPILYNDVKTQKIIPFILDENTKLSTSIPVFLIKPVENKPPLALVNIDTIVSFNKNTNEYDVDEKKLYWYLEAGYFARELYLKGKNISHTNIPVLGASLYAHMVSKILNKFLNLNVDKQMFDAVLFQTAKFHMIGMWELPDDEIRSQYALKACKQPNVHLIEMTSEDIVYDSFISFMTSLLGSKNILGRNAGKLNVTTFINMFVSMYGASALMTLEYVPTFLSHISGASNGMYVNNQKAFEDIIGKKDGHQLLLRVYDYLA